jgi:hypothetical protein
MIQLEYDYIARTLTQACYDVTSLQGEYHIAGQLTELVTPIHRLPAELLVLVFSIVPEEHFCNLMRTCRRWMEIALSMFAPLKLTSWTSLKQVESILNRGNGLLSVTIDPLSDVMDRSIGSLETEKYAALVLAASTSVSRWRTLEILSLPESQQTNAWHTVDTVPMNRLRSLSIPIHHDFSLFLDRLLPSIGDTTSDQLTDMHVCSVQVISYLAQSHCAKVFTHLTSFKCFLPRTDDVIDILPHFSQLTSLDVSGFYFPVYAADVELPLTKTLVQMSLRGVPVGWMNHREFPQLDSCTIVSPPVLDTIPITNLPLCRELFFEGPRFDPIRKFRISTACTLTLRSTQWSKPRGNEQLSRLWGAVPNEGVLRPISLHLHLTCGSEQLLRALCFMPELKELILELDRPTALGGRFFIGFLTPTLQIKWPNKWAGKGRAPLSVCPSLEVMGLKYRRWFRPGEVNEMPALVAMAHLDARDRKVKIWVEKGPDDHQMIQLNNPDISISALCSLGLLRLINGKQPSCRVRDVIEVSLAAFDFTSIKFSDAETLTLLLPLVYPCLLRGLRHFSLNVDVDEIMLLEALGHFERMEEIHLKRFMPSSPQPHLQLLRTLKKMKLDKTSLLWMEGCTFIKLGELEISEIEQESGGPFQCVRMMMCRSASLPQRISSEVLGAFQMPQLHTLRLLSYRVYSGRLHYPAIQQFKLHAASFHFVHFGRLQATLAMQPELETLEIRGLMCPNFFSSELPRLLDELIEPSAIDAAMDAAMDAYDGLDNSDHKEGSLMLEFPLCPKLKKLMLKMNHFFGQWNQGLVQGWLRALDMEKQAQQDMEDWERHWFQERKLVKQREQEQRKREDIGQLMEIEGILRPPVNQEGEQLDQLVQDVMQMQECKMGSRRWQELKRKLESVRVHQRRLYFGMQRVSSEGWKIAAVRQCRTLMRRRMENRCPLQRCQLELDSFRLEITNDSIGWPYLDMPDAEFLSLGDIFAVWQSRDL